MRRFHSAAAIFVVAAAYSATACTNMSAALTERVEAQRLGSDLRVQFTRAADAANRAVMADTDEMSAGAAREAEEATKSVVRDIEQLKTILQSLGYSEDLQVLDVFNARFADYRKLDEEILRLAVENTNLKAQRMSFGPAQQAADVFRTSIDAAVKVSGATDPLRVEVLAARALAALLQIQVLQAPHIAESDDAVMMTLEERMAASEADARRRLDQMKLLLSPKAGPLLAAAVATLDRFMAINGEIVTLSRRNSNVRSLALSLGRKRVLTAQCEDQLKALQAALEKHALSATR